MNDSSAHELIASLELITPTIPQERLSVRLTLLNVGSRRLLLPDPKITALRFQSSARPHVAEWYTRILLSVRSTVVTVLASGAAGTFDFDVHFRSTEIERFEPGNPAFHRWFVEVPPGEFAVWYEYQVADDFFDGDSHWRFADLQRAAMAENAVAWKGNIVSNTIIGVRS